MSTDLATLLRDALEQRRGDWPGIAVEAQVSYSWLAKFAVGKMSNPGYAMLVKLRDVIAPELAEAPRRKRRARPEVQPARAAA